MAENPEFKRNSNKRRYTEVAQKVRRMPSIAEKVAQADIKIPANLFEELTKIIDPETSTLEKIYSVVIKILKSCTNSSWVEFALIEDSKLKVCSNTQQQRVLDIDSNSSLMGYVASTENPILLTNPHTHSFYSKFPIKLEAFSLLTGTVVKPSSIACIPIYDSFLRLYGIVQLFNKIDRNLSQSFFTQEDVGIVSNIGKLLGTIFTVRKAFTSLEHRLDRTLRLVDSNKDMYQISNSLKRRHKLLSGLSAILKKDQKLTREILEAVSDVLEASSCYLFTANNSEISFVMSSGKKIDWEKIIPEIELSAFKGRGITVIRDLFPFDLDSQTKSCLILPLVTNEKEYTLVFFKDFSDFDEIDEQYSKKIVSVLSAYPLQVFESDFQMKFKITRMMSFEITQNDTFDFIKVLRHFKKKLSTICEVESCSVYIANQKEKTLWTKNSHSSEALIFPVSKDSIMGYTYLTNSVVELPNKNLNFAETSYYHNQNIVCLPINEPRLEDSVIGTLLLIKSSRFTEFEIWLVRKLIETFGCILYVQYLESIHKNIEGNDSKTVDPSLPSKNLFLQINKSPSISKKTSESRNLNNNSFKIQTALEEILRCEEVKIMGKELQEESEELKQMKSFVIEKKMHKYIPELDSDPSQSLLLVPIDQENVAYFRNIPFELDEYYIESIENITRLLFTSKLYQPIHEKIVEDARLESLIYKWTSQLISVSNSTLHKLFTCKSVIYKLAGNNDISALIKMGLDIINAITNTTDAFIVIKEAIGYSKYKDSISEASDAEIELVEECIKAKVLISKDFNKVEGNMIIVPIVYTEAIGAFILTGKKDDTNREFIKYSTKDEKLIVDYAKAASQAFSEISQPSKEALQTLTQHIRHSAIHYAPQCIFNAIRKCAQVLFDCDKVNLFFLNSEKLVMMGSEDEISEGFSVTVENSVFSESISTGKACFLNNVYDDPRFDPEIDKIAGYKTTSMMTLPIRNHRSKTFCVLQCINKRTSDFTPKDLENASKIIKVFENVVENWDLVRMNIEEIFRLKGISNTIASYILVFNQEKKLSYTNQPIEQIFGVTENEVHSISFTDWMSINKELMQDIESVYSNPSHKIRRTSQKIVPGKLKRLASLQSVIFEEEKSSNVFNYRVLQLQDISKETFSGVVLIMEDGSALEALHQEFREVQDQLRAMTSPISTETGLQKCIRELNYISYQLQNQEIKDQIHEVVERLKTGELKKPSFMLNNVDKHQFETVNSMFYIDSVEFDNSSTEYSPRSMVPDEITQLVPLDVLRDWNLNAFAIENKFDYVYSMLNDFNAIEHYQVTEDSLYNFISKVQKECDKRHNPFHNFNHCFSVMHSCYMLLSSTPAGSFFSGLNIFALLIAAICHDVDHTGRTNMYEINSKSKLAITYNDKSVLEQHHAAVAFEIVMQEDSNIFVRVSRESFREIRKIMISAIMGTDMSKHYSILTNINARAKDIANNPIGSLPKDIEKLSQFILHAADLAHPTKNYRVYEMWSLLVCQEFSDQHLDEISHELPITEFMKDLKLPKVYYANEIGFLTYVVRPLWDCANNLLKPNISFLVENVSQNIEEMKQKLEEWKKVES